jgi:hypothetical protein
VPTSVLLAVLAAAGLLALAPALVRRYDATERLVAERALSTARVLARAGAPRHRRHRTVPGRRPVNPPRILTHLAFAPPVLRAASPPAAAPAGAVRGVTAARRAEAGPDAVHPSGRGTDVAGRSTGGPAVRRVRSNRRWLAAPRAVHRRRRVCSALVLLNGVELLGVICVGPGFWIGFGLTAVLLAGYLVHLRNRALTDRRRRRAEARHAAWLTARQAAVRRAQARRAAQRREALRVQLLEREHQRREAARLNAHQALRGRAYEAGGHSAGTAAGF